MTFAEWRGKIAAMSMDDDLAGSAPKRPTRRRSKPNKAEEGLDPFLEEALRLYDLETTARPRSGRVPHPLTPAGPKLKVQRELSGWTVAEIADRTGVSLKVLRAFEKGDSAAASSIDLADLERLASACCCSLTDLLGDDVAAVRRSLRRRSSFSLDPLF